jgi:hypothetical protein
MQLIDRVQTLSTDPDFKGLSDNLKEDKREAKQVSEALLRFDDALEDVIKNY